MVRPMSMAMLTLTRGSPPPVHIFWPSARLANMGQPELECLAMNCRAAQRHSRATTTARTHCAVCTDESRVQWLDYTAIKCVSAGRHHRMLHEFLKHARVIISGTNGPRFCAAASVGARCALTYFSDGARQTVVVVKSGCWRARRCQFCCAQLLHLVPF